MVQTLTSFKKTFLECGNDQYLSNCVSTPHPPLTHQQSTDNNLGLMIGWGGGGDGCVVVQILTLIRTFSNVDLHVWRNSRVD